MWNRYRMFILIYIEHRNPETRNSRNWFRYETFITFELKVFRHEERERDTHTIFLCWLLLNRQLSIQPMRGACSAQSRLASPSSESQPSSSEAGTQLTAFFSNLSPRFRGVTPPKYPDPNSYQGFLFWHLWMTHPLRALMNISVNVAPN